MTNEQIERAAEVYATQKTEQDVPESYGEMTHRRVAMLFDSYDIEQAYEDGANFATSHQWVSVSERLPEEGAMVTAHSPNGRIDVLKYHDEEFIDELHQAHCVDFWLPIPQLNPEKE